MGPLETLFRSHDPALERLDTRERAALQARMDEALSTEEADALATACTSREAELRAAFIALAPDGPAS